MRLHPFKDASPQLLDRPIGRPLRSSISARSSSFIRRRIAALACRSPAVRPYFAGLAPCSSTRSIASDGLRRVIDHFARAAHHFFAAVDRPVEGELLERDGGEIELERQRRRELGILVPPALDRGLRNPRRPAPVLYAPAPLHLGKEALALLAGEPVMAGSDLGDVALAADRIWKSRSPSRLAWIGISYPIWLYIGKRYLRVWHI